MRNPPAPNSRSRSHLHLRHPPPVVGIRFAVQRLAEERLDDAVELLADAGDLALGDALAAEVLDAAGGDTPHVGLLPSRSLGILMSSVPTRVSHGRSRYPFR